MRRIFVTGTDTGVGKSIVSAGLLRLAHNRNLRAIGIKPVETGCLRQHGALFPEDGAFLRNATHNTVSLDICAPLRFTLPAAPHRAALHDGARIDIDQLVHHIDSASQGRDFVLIEGAGGLLVPIAEHFLTVDLVQELECPVLVVGRTGLGTINHSLLTLEALKARGIEVLGLVLSQTNEESGPEEEYTPSDLMAFMGDVPLQVLEFVDDRNNPGSIAETMEKTWPGDLIEKWLGLRKG